MCTVQNSNERSMEFFKRHGFSRDSDTPEKAKYTILSKQL